MAELIFNFNFTSLCQTKLEEWIYLLLKKFIIRKGKQIIFNLAQKPKVFWTTFYKLFLPLMQ